MGEAFDNNTARLAVVGEDPLLLSNQDPDKVSREIKQHLLHINLLVKELQGLI